jgi:hypothetical protein
MKTFDVYPRHGRLAGKRKALIRSLDLKLFEMVFIVVER